MLNIDAVLWTCNSFLTIGIRRFIGCNHIRAYEFFTESVNSDCPFYGFVCDTYDNFSVGRCPWGCGPDRSLCSPMGLKADKWKKFAGEEPVKMFLHTSNTEPFCSKSDLHFQVIQWPLWSAHIRFLKTCCWAFVKNTFILSLFL